MERVRERLPQAFGNTRRDVDETETKTKKDLNETALFQRFEQSEAQRLDEVLDTLRKGCPSGDGSRKGEARPSQQ